MRRDTDWIGARAHTHGTATAVIDGLSGERWTYADLEKRSSALALYLQRLGVSRGERVALLAPNHISVLDFLFACRKLGAIFVPLNWRLHTRELQQTIDDCQPALLAYHEKQEELASQLTVTRRFSVSADAYRSLMGAGSDPLAGVELPMYAMEDPWLMIYTGGTTGQPKGTLLSNRNVYANAINTILSWGLHETDTTLTVLPMFHSGGLNALTLPILLAGGTVVLLSDFEPELVVQLLVKYRCTNVLMVPTMYHRLLQLDTFQRASFPQIKMFLSGGAPCPRQIYDYFEQRSLPFKEGYGLTEAGPNNFYLSPEQAKGKKGSVGKPMLYNTVRLLDEKGRDVPRGEVGELVIAGEHVFEQYWNNEEATAQAKRDGWLFTGDLACQDEEGYYYIMGRKKDMIISGGENVYPLEVEQVLLRHPYVQEVAVIGLPDETWGECVTAVIVPATEAEIGERELTLYCSERLARYKVPKRFAFLKQLPKTHVGKIDKKTLQQQMHHIQRCITPDSL